MPSRHCTVKYSCGSPPPCSSLSKTATVGARTRTHTQDTCLRSHTRAQAQDIRTHARAQVSRGGLSGLRPAEAGQPGRWRSVGCVLTLRFFRAALARRVQSLSRRVPRPAAQQPGAPRPVGWTVNNTNSCPQPVGPRVTSLPVRNNRASARSVAAGEGPSL